MCAVTPADVQRAGCVVAGRCWRCGPAACRGSLTASSRSAGALGRERDAANLVGRDEPHRRRPRRGRSTVVRRASSRWSGPIRCSRWATGARSSSRRPTAASCWAKKENTPAPSTGTGCARRPGMAHRRAVRFRPGGHASRGADAGSAAGLVRPARCGKGRWCWPTATDTSTDPGPRSWRRWRSWRRSSTDTRPATAAGPG